MSDPTTTPLGPSAIVMPSGKVKVSCEAGKLKDEPPIITPSGTEVCGTEVETEPKAGSKVNVFPSVVIARGPVPEGKPKVSVPIIIPLGPKITDWPLGSVMVVDSDGKE